MKTLDTLSTHPVSYRIYRMSPEDAEEVVAFMRSFPEVHFCDWEDEALLCKILELPGTIGFVARAFREDIPDCPGRVVGAVLAGVIGLRGTINHLAVCPECRRIGVGRALAQHTLSALRQAGIQRMFLFVAGNAGCAMDFWSSLGFKAVRSETTLECDVT